MIVNGQVRVGVVLAGVVLTVAACVPAGPLSGADLVAAKAGEIAEQIGGVGRFGGMMMAAYNDEREDHMGFHGEGDLAISNGMMEVTLENRLDVACAFDLVHMAGHLGLAEQHVNVDVPAGEQTTVEVPCSEFIGLGSLETVGESAARCADGVTVDNMMAVPGFLGLDYDCHDGYHFVVDTDRNDLDQDGDVEERIAVSLAADRFMSNRGMGMGMMGHPR